MSAPSPIPSNPSPPPLTEMEQLRADVTQVKVMVAAIRRAQRRSVWLGAIKLLFYLGLIGASAALLKTYVGSGLEAITNPAALYEGSVSGSSPFAPVNFGAVLQNLRELQR